jgi:ABC-2 type transport system ATP-binding protein
MRGTREHVLELVALTKIFRDFWGHERVKAVDSLDLEVRRGEVFGLLGPNGSGKTTTVRIVLGLLFPTSGAVRIFGKSPRNVDMKRRVGYMPEESHLYSYLNAEETLDFFGRLFGLGSQDRKRRTDALLEMVGLNRARRRPIGEYSKGMARRIGLAQSLINDPDLLILDEPTTGLDPVGSREMKDLILTLRERGKTILLCSHLLSDVEEICDRICILYGGKRRALGTVRELLTAEEITQIRTPRLDQDAVEQIIELIRRRRGHDALVDVTSPTRRLEEFFLDVVREARRERLATAGAEIGAGAAGFLSGELPEGEELVEQLVEAAQAPDTSQQRQETPVAIGGVRDARLIQDLVDEGTAPDEQPQELAPSVSPETRVREEVLNELIIESDEGPQPDDKDHQQR